MTEPSREQLFEEGRKQARIYGVDAECAEVYAEGWAAGARRITELERQHRCVQATDRHNLHRAAIADLQRDCAIRERALVASEEQAGVLEERIRKAKEILEITEDWEIPAICWGIAKEVLAALDGEGEKTDG